MQRNRAQIHCPLRFDFCPWSMIAKWWQCLSAVCPAEYSVPLTLASPVHCLHCAPTLRNVLLIVTFKDFVGDWPHRDGEAETDNGTDALQSELEDSVYWIMTQALRWAVDLINIFLLYSSRLALLFFFYFLAYTNCAQFFANLAWIV